MRYDNIFIMEVSAEVMRERVIRHNRLMKMIRNYHRSTEESAKLERIKVNTMMEINLRFIRSNHNRNYHFPKVVCSEDEEKDDQLQLKHQSICDLFAQNKALKNRSLSSKVISLDNSRRVNSLEAEGLGWQQERLLRLNAKSKQNMSLKHSHSLKKLPIPKDQSKTKLGIDTYNFRKHLLQSQYQELSQHPQQSNALKPAKQKKESDDQRQSYKQQNMFKNKLANKSPYKQFVNNKEQISNKNVSPTNQNSGLHLPDLKRIKTEGTNNVQSVIGRKLHTQFSQSNPKIKGLAKYLKEVEQKQKDSHRKKITQILA